MYKPYLYALAVAWACIPFISNAQTNEDIPADVLQKLKPIIEQEVQRQLNAASQTNAPVSVSPASQPVVMPVRSGNSYANWSFDGLFAMGGSSADDIEGGTQLGGHDPKQRGFTVQNLELSLAGHVDPYLNGQANIVLQIDPAGETTVEAEEAFLETTELPWNLQIKAGQFFTEFGRLNPTHPHTWGFVDQPLVNGRFFGEDGLRGPGARVSWLVPTPFYSELFMTVQNSQGGTAFSFRNDHSGEPYLGRLHEQGSVNGLGDMLYTPRYVMSFDPTENQTLLAGVSAALGPNGSGTDTDTCIFGMDLFWKWKSPRAHGGFPYVSWQTEIMHRRYEAGAFSEDLDGSGTLDPDEPDLNGDGIINSVPSETLSDYGMYSQLLYGFRKNWVCGFRGDYLAPDGKGSYETVYGSDPDRAARLRLAPNVTWYPSEFSKLRLQCNFDHRDLMGEDYSVWLQFGFLIGSHAAHQF